MELTTVAFRLGWWISTRKSLLMIAKCIMIYLNNEIVNKIIKNILAFLLGVPIDMSAYGTQQPVCPHYVHQNYVHFLDIFE